MKSKKSVSMKAVVVLMALVLLIGCGVGGTLAWLMDHTDTVTNTFTVGDINIKLYEHELDANGEFKTTETKTINTYKILPGTSEKKDPTVEVLKNSEDCYVFVQVQEVNNVAAEDASGNVTHKYVTWAIDDAVWTELNKNADGTITTYYLTSNYTLTDADATFNVLKDKKVSYGDSLTKEMIEMIYETEEENGQTVIKVGEIDPNKQPKLIFKAFAVQKEAANTAAAAWNEVPAAERLGATTTP